MMTRTCQATRRDGQPCKTPVVADSCFCFAHDPALATKRTEARQQGGANKATARRLSRLMPARLVPVYAQLEQALADVLAGVLEPKQAAAAANLGRALVAVLQAGEVEARLRALEERAS